MLQRGAAELGVNFTSPLAQVYHPLVVDDDLVDANGISGSPVNVNSATPSYAPITRRRLSSMHRFPVLDPQNSPTSNNLRRFPTASARGGVLDLTVPERLASGEGEDDEHQEERSHVQEPSEPEPAGEIIENEQTEGVLPQVNQRLREIEERQKRMEEMLLRLMSELRSIRSAVQG